MPATSLRWGLLQTEPSRSACWRSRCSRPMAYSVWRTRSHGGLSRASSGEATGSVLLSTARTMCTSTSCSKTRAGGGCKQARWRLLLPKSVSPGAAGAVCVRCTWCRPRQGTASPVRPTLSRMRRCARRARKGRCARRAQASASFAHRRRARPQGVSVSARPATLRVARRATLCRWACTRKRTQRPGHATQQERRCEMRL